MSDRERSASLSNIVTYCGCGRRIVGDLAWASHRSANADHAPITYTAWRAAHQSGERS